jgi:exopolysaccharide biosynthesis polyprenyl glycosylphosphotransferase
MGTKINEMLRKIAFSGLRVADIGLIMLSFGLAMIASADSHKWKSPAALFASKVSLSSCVLFAVGMLACHAIFSLCGLYGSKRMSSKRTEAVDVLRAMMFSTICLWFEGRVFFILVVTPYFLAAFWAVGSVTVVATRLTLRYALSGIRKRGLNLHYVLILGTNGRAIKFARDIETMADRGYRLLGFADSDWPGMDRFKETGLPLACSIDELSDFLKHSVVDEVAIYLPLRSFYEHAAQMAKLCEHHGISLRFDSDIFDLKIARACTEVMDGAPQIMARSTGIEGWPLLLKRVIDIACSTALLIVLSPLLLVVAALIKCSSAGPALFQQKRVGLNKRQFTMFKFRTMVPSAESVQESLLHLNEMTGPAFKIKNDPRLTPIGRILRKTSIDELPQLINVLRGEMSLVGPRPMSVRDYQFFSEDWQRRRFSVPPGITCLWQVCGRNAIPFDQWMVLDMQYIDKWSLWLDLKILARTIPAVLKGSGAA